MLANYLPILMFLGVSTALATVLMTLGFFLGHLGTRLRGDTQKLSPYECGFEAFEDMRARFDVRYYLVAILFIVFDMGIFLTILVVGFIYEWKKGALEWD